MQNMLGKDIGKMRPKVVVMRFLTLLGTRGTWRQRQPKVVTLTNDFI